MPQKTRGPARFAAIWALRLPRELRSEPAYTDSLVCTAWRGNRAIGRSLTLAQFLGCRHVEVALQGKHAIDYVDTVLSRLGRSQSIALSVPQFTTAAAWVVGTPFIAMLPESMGRHLASTMPLKLIKPPLSLPSITIKQVWHARTDADPATALLRAIIRDAGKAAPFRGGQNGKEK